MLDPATAIGVASSVISFVNLAGELISGASEVYRSASGNTDENAHIETVISDLRGVTHKLDVDHVAGVAVPRSLRRLVNQCGELGDELLRLLMRLRLDGNENKMWGSIVVAWRSMLKAHDVESMQKRLGEYRSEIQLELSFLFR
jgi:hypothetical protein